MLLANIIWIFHVLIVLFIIFAPFFDFPLILILHITFSFCILVHWYCNNNVCSLTLIEGYFRGKSREETLSHQFIAPIYNIPKTEWNKICWVIVIILMCVSVYNLIYSKKLSKFLNSKENLKIKLRYLFENSKEENSAN
jgi:hypothetical protein